MRSLILRFCLVLGIWFAVLTMATAQTSAPTLTAIEAEINALESDAGLSDADKSDVITQLNTAKTALTTAKNRTAQVDAYAETAANAESILTDLANQLEAATYDASADIAADNPEVMRGRLTVLDAERLSVAGSVSGLQSRQTILSQRAAAIADDLAKAREALSNAQEKTGTPLPADADAVQRAKRLTDRAILTSQKSAVDNLQRELASIPARKPVIAARIDLAQYRITQLDKEIAELRQALSENRLVQADILITNAREELAAAQNADLEVIKYAKENLTLAETLKEIESRGPIIDQRTSRYTQEADKLRQSGETVQRVLNTGSLSDEVSGLLRQIRAGLPKLPPLNQALEENEDTRVEVQLNLVLWQNHLESLDGASQADDAIVPQLTESRLDHGNLKHGDLYDLHDDILTALLDAGRIQSQKLTDQEIALKDLIQQTTDLAALLDRRLLWLPTNRRLSGNTLKNIPSGLGWILSPPSWGLALKDLWAGLTKNLFESFLLLLFPTILFVLKPTFKRLRTQLATRIGDVRRDTFWVTPAAIGICILLALPIALLLINTGLILTLPDTASAFTQALSAALVATGLLFFTLNIFRVMSQKEGLFVQHFNWNETARAKLQKHLTWFIWVQAITVFFFVLATQPGISSLRYGVGVAAFVANSLGMAAMSYAVLRPQDGVVAKVIEHPSKALFIICPIFVLTPLVIGLMPVFGYFDTSLELQSKLFASGLQFLAASIFFGLLTRFYVVAKRRSELRKALARRAATKASRDAQESVDASGNAVPDLYAKRDPEEIKRTDREMINFLLLITGIYLAIRLWMIWSPIIPALGIADEIVLWGDDTDNPLTLSRLTVSILLIVGGLLAARNIRRFLDASVFERFHVETGTRFAFGTIASYILAGLGLVIGLAHLGLDWSKLQWIVAALGVGLGFGLQEIVANFVSGLIILFERPVRVGDLVTIGNLSGTVSNIQVRATTVTDFDNREVLLPNKTIITENVTNWTLRDDVTRLVITIGVAYGSDIKLVRDLIMKVGTDHPDVLATPPPTVFFLNHGESSLDYELRVFVDTPTKRPPVTHDLNAGINQTLKDNGIEIPFPQRDLNFKPENLPGFSKTK